MALQAGSTQFQGEALSDLIAIGVTGSFFLFLCWAGASLLLAQRKDAELSARLPETLSYKWGYFLGYSGIIAAVLVVVAGAVLIAIGIYRGWFLIVMAYAVIFGVASYGVLARRRWGWLFHIPLSLNMGFWAFNSVYAFNRWRELGNRK